MKNDLLDSLERQEILESEYTNNGVLRKVRVVGIGLITLFISRRLD